MVKIINIDTKTKTIRIENSDGKIKAWRTTESGAHFPIKEGETTKQALDKFVSSKQKSSTGKSEPKPSKQFLEHAERLLSPHADTYDKRWIEEATSLMEDKNTPVEIVRRMQEKSPSVALRSPKVSAEFLNKVIEDTNTLSKPVTWDNLVRCKALTQKQKEKIKAKLEKTISALQDGSYRDFYAWDLRESTKESKRTQIEDQINALEHPDQPKEEYKPFLVIDKDTGNTKEFDSLAEARKFYSQQIQDNWGSDIRMMKIDTDTGNFLKWL